jgi:two-component system heavy metal sensor histidine kinase CusS
MSSKSAQNNEGPAGAPARHWSLAYRLTLLYIATTAVLLILAAAYLYWSQVANLEREDNDFLVNKIQDCARALEERSDEAQLSINEIQTEPAASIIKYYVRLLDEQKRPLLETPGMSNVLAAAIFPAAVKGGEIPESGTLHRTHHHHTWLLMSAETPAKARAGGRRTLQVALDVSEEAELIENYRWTLLTVVMTGILFSGGAGLLVTKRGLAPLKEMTRATRRITASQLHERIVADGWPVELASLAHSFDEMLDRLEDSFKRLSQFSADLAHELRTPINNLRGEAGVALSQPRAPEEYRQTLESSLEEYARLARLIDNLLFLARSDGSKMVINRAPCDVQASLETVRGYYEALAEDRGVAISCEGGGTLHADPVLFRQAVSNLLSNALNYTPAGGRVLIQAGRKDGAFEIGVSDTGRGIPQEHLPRIFDRLYRADPARSEHPSGAGLGLSIVKSIMALHGGSVTVQSEAGEGTRFLLTFPDGVAPPN